MESEENLPKEINHIDILACAPPNITLRNIQIDALKWVQDTWNDHEVMVINIPVGGGKSLIAMTIAEWVNRNGFGKVALITPTKMLQDQYTKEFTWVVSLKGAGAYDCFIAPDATCRTTKSILGTCCPEGKCQYLNTRAAATVADKAIFNQHSYLYLKEGKKDFLVIDEGHNSINFVFDHYSLTMWGPDYEFDESVNVDSPTILDLIDRKTEALKDDLATARSHKAADLVERLEEEIESCERAYYALDTFGEDVLISKKTGKYMNTKFKKYHNTEQTVLKIKPTKIDRLGRALILGGSSKVVFLSATVSVSDANQMGFHDVGYFESESPIPKENRPFVAIPVASMNYKDQTFSIPVLAAYIERILAKHPTEKGLIHCTYALQKELEKKFKGSRFIFHDSNNKLQAYNRFRESKGNEILVASGMSEGVDLPGELARFQIITKVQYPSLDDEVMKWICKNNPDLYRWQAVKTIIQQSGRICRGPEDYGVTYMLDSEFDKLYAITRKVWPKWFSEAIIKLKA